MEELINKYIIRNYEVEDGRIKCLISKSLVWGSDVSRLLSKVFNTEHRICHDLLKTWFISKSQPKVAEGVWCIANLKPIIPYEPKRNNRFIITFPDFLELEQYMVKSGSRPSVKFGCVTDRIRGGSYKLQTNMTWEDIEIKFYDFIGPSTTQRIFDSLVINQNIGCINVELEMLDPIGVVIEKWVINGVITTISFGDLDYSSEETAEISMIIRPNNCVLLY